MTDIPESWQPLRSRETGEPVTLTWEQIYACQRAFYIWQQVVDKEQADRPPEGRQNFMGNPANWQKSVLLGRLLTEGKPPLPHPPPRAMSAPWYALIEEGHAYLNGGAFCEVYGPYERGAKEYFNICQDIGWEVKAQVLNGWILTYPNNGDWLLRLWDEEIDPQVQKGTSIASGKPEPIYFGAGDWVLERMEA